MNGRILICGHYSSLVSDHKYDLTKDCDDDEELYCYSVTLNYCLGSGFRIWIGGFIDGYWSRSCISCWSLQLYYQVDIDEGISK